MILVVFDVAANASVSLECAIVNGKSTFFVPPLERTSMIKSALKLYVSDLRCICKLCSCICADPSAFLHIFSKPPTLYQPITAREGEGPIGPPRFLRMIFPLGVLIGFQGGDGLKQCPTHYSVRAIEILDHDQILIPVSRVYRG